jgi:2-oxoglutarate dehydrogenase E1 component
MTSLARAWRRPERETAGRLTRAPAHASPRQRAAGAPGFRYALAPRPAAMTDDRTLSSYNLPFLEEIWEAYQRDPNGVEPHWRELMDRAERGVPWPATTNGRARAVVPTAVTEPHSATSDQVMLQNLVDKLIQNYRLMGHLRADIDPLERPRSVGTPSLDLAYVGLSDSHLSRSFNPGHLFPGREIVPLREIIGRLQRTYCRKVGVEYWQINRVEHREWLREQMEPIENVVVPEPHEQRDILRRLVWADNVDRFIHNKFVGAKRFSIAGAESMLSLLATIIDASGDHGVEAVYMAMAHRGRINVMMNILGLTPAQVFSRFTGGDPFDNLGRGDVKYHLGCYHRHVTQRGQEMYLALMFNPSHLEAITPVLAGRVRAGQDLIGDEDRARALGVTLHGDAAVIGQGVYAETLNLSRLPGYRTGGTIRIVINNQVGFTTNPKDARSTTYATAMADMLHCPVFHVNGDDPEAAAFVGKLAVAFRQRFQSDVIIDLVCYRRYGHNEGDEPSFTQPAMYEIIKNRPGVRTIYQNLLLERGTVTQADVEALDAESRAEFEAAIEEVTTKGFSTAPSPMHGVWEDYVGGPDSAVPEVDTSIDRDTVDAVARAMTTLPEGFHLHKKLERFLAELREMAAGETPVSWAFAEHLAYGSLLREGAGVRVSGQDSVRGTFTHRHAGFTDTVTERRYFPLDHIEGKKGRFEILNSPLSEFAVLGFEFGYSLAAPGTLVIWEAQFGDFVNGAQVIIDQFMSSSEDKWNRISGIVLFLPHGYEGQGPEHSSARLERFLQLCAEDNMQVCNFTTTAQLFHALRRQVRRKWRKPLVVMTPKSLLRTRSSFSPLSEFLEGKFQRAIDDETVADPGKVTRVLMCSGKVFYDLQAARAEHTDVAIVRVEQIHPFPAAQLEEILARYPAARELYWVQEEPHNMGAWFFVSTRLAVLAGGRFRPVYVGRDESASPATGSPSSHQYEQEKIIEASFAGLA